MKYLMTLAALAGNAAASSWVFWACDIFADFCLEGGVCVTQDSYWVQYSEPNGGGEVQKKGFAREPKSGASYYCPINNIRSDEHDDELVVIYKQFDAGAPGGGDVSEFDACPEGQLFEPDGSTLLGTNDGSGTLPGNGGGDGFCPSASSCNCVAHLTVNSP